MMDSLMEVRSPTFCSCCFGYQRQASQEGDVAERVSSTDDDPQQQPREDYVIVGEYASISRFQNKAKSPE